MKYSTKVRDAGLDARVNAIGPAPRLELRAGAAPARCSARATGDVLAQGRAPEIWMEPARDGLKVMRGPWELVGVLRGTAGHLRVMDAEGRECHALANVGTDVALDRRDVEPTQAVRVTMFTLRAGNA